MPAEKRVIKKYPNRRLYDTAISGYITIAEVKQMVLEFNDIEVVDAKTGEDLTRQVLLQILLEEEAGSTPLFSNDILSQFIRLYGHTSQSMLAPFFEQNMKIFQEWQKRVQEQAKGATPWFNPFELGGLPTPSLADWQQQLQQQSRKFWQTMGVVAKDKDQEDGE